MKIKFDIKKMAKVEKASISLDDFILFIGDNNSGKTLMMQLIYGLVELICNWRADYDVARIMENDDVIYMRFDEVWFKDVEKKINIYLQENKELFVLHCFSRYIPIESITLTIEDTEGLFYIATMSETLSLEKQYPNGERDTLIAEMGGLSENIKDKITNYVLKDMLGMVYDENQIFLPAARAGLQMMYRYFFVSPVVNNTSFPLSIYDYLKFLQTYTTKTVFSKEEKELVGFMENNLLQGTMDFENNEFIFKEGENSIPLNYASSMVHELSVLTSVLKSNNRFGYVYYDEVENSVHPLAQGDVARTLVRLCNSGKKIIASTHSDTMAGKINNLILLSRMKNIGKRNDRIRKVGLSVLDMLIQEKTITVYEFIKNNGKVKVEALEFMPYPNIGYIFQRFNENIDQLYDESNSIMEENENIEA